MEEIEKLSDVIQKGSWELLETILYDGNNFFFLEKHLQRLVTASKDFGWKKIDIDLVKKKLWDSVHHCSSSKVRLTVSQNGIINIHVSPFIASKNLFGIFSKNNQEELIQWKVYLDIIPMEDELRPFLCHKTTYRSPYEAARKRLKIGEGMEVLLYNQSGYIMEGSICSVAFFRNQQWITPSLKEGGLPGVMREILLEKKYITEGSIHVSSLVDGEHILLFNSLRGCFKGILYCH